MNDKVPEEVEIEAVTADTQAENADTGPVQVTNTEDAGGGEEAATSVSFIPEGKPATFISEVYSWYDTMLHALLAVVVIFLFFTRMSTVDGTSMLPTLEDQQRLMVTNFFYTPAYNDIVVVWADGLPNDEDGYGKAIVKRVIGLPGDKINIDFIGGRVYRNGEQLELEVKDGVLYEDGHMINSYTNLEEGRGGDFTVPEGMIFVMGDNRNGSTDSRSGMVGYIDMREIVGKAYLRIWPFDRISGLY